MKKEKKMSTGYNRFLDLKEFCLYKCLSELLIKNEKAMNV